MRSSRKASWFGQIKSRMPACGFLGIDEDHLVDLECIGFRRGKIEKSRFNSLPADVVTLDFSGWPI